MDTGNKNKNNKRFFFLLRKEGRKLYIITKNNYYHIDYACILYSKFQLCHKSRHGAVAQEKRSCCGFDSRNESFYILFPDNKAKGYSVRLKKGKT